MALVAAAVQARLPHPTASPEARAAGQPAAIAPEDDHDALLRRLRELGDLHKSGVLTDEEFATAKRAGTSSGCRNPRRGPLAGRPASPSRPCGPVLLGARGTARPAPTGRPAAIEPVVPP